MQRTALEKVFAAALAGVVIEVRADQVVRIGGSKRAAQR